MHESETRGKIRSVRGVDRDNDFRSLLETMAKKKTLIDHSILVLKENHNAHSGWLISMACDYHLKVPFAIHAFDLNVA